MQLGACSHACGLDHANFGRQGHAQNLTPALCPYKHQAELYPVPHSGMVHGLWCTTPLALCLVHTHMDQTSTHHKAYGPCKPCKRVGCSSFDIRPIERLILRA